MSQTLKKYQQQGVAALQEDKRTGVPAHLSTEQLSQLVTVLNKGVIFHGFIEAIWMRQRVTEVIKKLFGVSYDPSQVGRIWTKLSWSRQKPQRKASKIPRQLPSDEKSVYLNLKKRRMRAGL